MSFANDLHAISELGFLSNKEREDFFLSDEEDEDENFKFKYVPVSKFKNIIKDVRRQRIKVDDERTWNTFLKQQRSLSLPYQEDNVDPSISNVKKFLRDNFKEVDRELMRLEEDALPERRKRPSSSVNENVQDFQVQGTRVESPKEVPVMKDSDTGSTNILLTIPEEENILSTYKKGLESRQECRLNNANRISSSDHRIIRRKDRTRTILHAIDDSEYNSSPELSPDLASDPDDLVDVRADPIVVRKVLFCQKKISRVLDEISLQLDKIPLPDGERDLYRRQQRVMEFAIRFSRNYLYELGRQVTEIQRHVRAISPSVRVKPSRRCRTLHMQAIEQKLVAAHQLMLQALTAYCRHIPSSALKSHPGKLKEVLQILVDLVEICAKIHLTPYHFGSGDADEQLLTNLQSFMRQHRSRRHENPEQFQDKDLLNKCSNILSKLRPGSDNESQVVSNRTQSTLATAPSASRTRRRNSAKNLTNRLSMYSVDVRNSRKLPFCSQQQQREKERGTVRSRMLSSNHPGTPELPNPHSSPASNKSSKEMTRRVNPRIKERLLQKDGDIRTMMDMIPTDSEAGSSIEHTDKFKELRPSESKFKVSRKSSTRIKTSPRSKHSGISMKSTKNDMNVGNEVFANKVTTITEEHLSNLVPVIADLISFIRNKDNDCEIRPVSSASVETLLGLLGKYEPAASDLHENLSNSKNMQLICLSSDEIANTLPKYMDASCQAKLDKMSDSQSESSIANDVMKFYNQKKEKKRLIISKESEAIILDYRDRYQAWCRENPMYSSNTQNKPWEVVAWISDKLVDELINEISKELQMDDVIKKLFDLEFQEF
ncbi:uncharacterized protein LOC107272446 [Cephus cinctus]|uniref:Uncharacterized protein LOC107272446 n=1 Tax=Cephus cinctus TaxID=211228 RepID=A0AAJ7CAC1_CEPCN|nr:uncharacterized protein LOC107272446 [Cephus cinctus]XP_015605097.1 uncharacterized protein LOC107272446 [Cephus cinctus]